MEDLVQILDHSNLDLILEKFGTRTKRQDPIVHFYETFLATYDPALREQRGVYYTPEPVVSYLVSSVDRLLATRFGCKQGLADATTIPLPRPDEETKKVEHPIHKVLILDPACGTGTFLYEVVDLIRERFRVKRQHRHVVGICQKPSPAQDVWI